MRTATVSMRDVGASLRFDSKFHLSKHNPLLQQLSRSGLPLRTVEQLISKEAVWCGNIFTRVYATDEAHGKPLLAPYDVFRFLPWSDKILSRSEVSHFDRLQIKRGSLLVVCSGRNLGPATIADKFCEQFIMSHDMIRIDGDLSDEQLYIAAFLNTGYGQALIRTDMNGSVIDHTDAPAVRALRIPIVPDAAWHIAVDGSRDAFLKREGARLTLMALRAEFAKHFGLEDIDQPYADRSQPRRFSVRASELGGRLDVEPHVPQYTKSRAKITSRGGCALSNIAKVARPGSRYKTSYVQDATFGIPLLNGRQIAQYKAIGLKLMNISGFENPETFELNLGTTLVTADGRAEENLADCALVTRERVGWGASGHVHRVIPHNHSDAGFVYLACSCAAVQAQLKSLSTGSVVDALSEEDVGSVIVPYEDSDAARDLGKRAVAAWEAFADAAEAEQRATDAIEDAIRTAGS